jgi:imidazolonepropionase-like amidohydrolase
MELMLEAGVPLEDVLYAATKGGWESCGGDRCGRRFGWFAAGVAADIIALDADPRLPGVKDVFRRVDFVMKDAKVWKQGGEPTAEFLRN